MSIIGTHFTILYLLDCYQIRSDDMSNLIDITAKIGGILLFLTLIGIGILLICNKERPRGFLFLLAGLALILIYIKTFFSP